MSARHFRSCSGVKRSSSGCNKPTDIGTSFLDRIMAPGCGIWRAGRKERQKSKGKRQKSKGRCRCATSLAEKQGKATEDTEDIERPLWTRARISGRIERKRSPC